MASKKPKPPKPGKPAEAAAPKVRTAAAVIAAMRTKYGGDVFVKPDRAGEVQVIPTGSLELDKALGIGGWARGRVIEIWSQESCGKTTLALHALANVQRMGFGAVLVDAEQTFEAEYAERIGVDVDALGYSAPRCGEESLAIVEEFAAAPEIALIVIDSVAILTPRDEIAGELGDAPMGKHARLMGQHMRRVVALAKRNNVALMYLNQIRQKIGVRYGSPNTTTGGNSLKFFASQRVSLHRGDKIAGGMRVKATVAKNKIAIPHLEAEFSLLFGEGIDKIGELAIVAVSKGVICEEPGYWYCMPDEDGELQKIAHGKNGLREKLAESAELRADVAAKLAKHGILWG